MARKPGVEGGANRLNVFMNALLHVSIRSFTIRMKKDDAFEGQSLLDLPGKLLTRVSHEVLFQSERFYQKRCEKQWNPEARQKWLLDRKQPDYQADPESREVLKHLQRARIVLPHPYLINARYGAVANGDEISDNKQTYLANKRKELKERLRGKWASSRLRIVVNLLLQLLEADSKLGILVFAETLCALDALEVALDHFKVGCDRFDGTLSKEERAKVVDLFNKGTHNNIMLITSRSGSFGIDLTRASRVISLQDGWNPAIYTQAIDRAHRFRQTKVVHVYTFHAPFSVDHKTSRAMDIKRVKAGDLFDPGAALSGEIRKMRDYDKDTLKDKVMNLCSQIGSC
jgi:SNF2 family DNA or RNA helicase